MGPHVQPDKKTPKKMCDQASCYLAAKQRSGGGSSSKHNFGLYYAQNISTHALLHYTTATQQWINDETLIHSVNKRAVLHVCFYCVWLSSSVYSSYHIKP